MNVPITGALSIVQDFGWLLMILNNLFQLVLLFLKINALLQGCASHSGAGKPNCGFRSSALDGLNPSMNI
jgi:hypothetical protein